MQGSFMRSCLYGPCVAATQKNELDANFSFPDRRHSFYSGECIQECCTSIWSVRGRHTKMNWTPDFHFLIVVTPFTQASIQECCTSIMVRAWPPHKNELDARFSFPDRRHSFYSGVCPEVRSALLDLAGRKSAIEIDSA
jgi:hypothetical protein